MQGWLETKVAERRDWAPGLATLRFDAPPPSFRAGQWLNFALWIDGEFVKRAYSLASAPGEPLEIFLTHVERGAFSPRLFAMQPGESIFAEEKARGFFTLEHVPSTDELWMFASGTGIGPFISMLRTPEPWQRFRRLFLVHGVRQVAHLAYQEELQRLSALHDDALTWVPVVSREPDASGVVHGRVTTALEDGSLGRFAGAEPTPERAHVLLCGNPAMIDDSMALLEARGMVRHRLRKPGHITTERYW